MAMRVARKGVVILAAFLSIWFGKTWVSSLRNQQLTASQLEAILISLPSLPDDEQIKTMARIGELPLETWQKVARHVQHHRLTRSFRSSQRKALSNVACGRYCASWNTRTTWPKSSRSVSVAVY